jgi:hypothetical protein
VTSLLENGNERVMTMDYLISFDDDTRGMKSADKFLIEWNDLYPEYRVRVKSNPHDFGYYYSVEIAEAAYADEEVFPQGPESAACDLADKLGLNY